jgi:ABC-type multidrug transport system fused ATPase/permease subunit
MLIVILILMLILILILMLMLMLMLTLLLLVCLLLQVAASKISRALDLVLVCRARLRRFAQVQSVWREERNAIAWFCSALVCLSLLQEGLFARQEEEKQKSRKKLKWYMRYRSSRYTEDDARLPDKSMGWKR